jgi:hypothetical protein
MVNGTDANLKTEVLEKGLEQMEALLLQSAKGIHILFENQEIAGVLKHVKDDKDFFDFQKMKKVQDVMSVLINKKTFLDKVSYLKELDPESYQLVVRTYFHIVENTVRATSDHRH